MFSTILSAIAMFKTYNKLENFSKASRNDHYVLAVKSATFIRYDVCLSPFVVAITLRTS